MPKPKRTRYYMDRILDLFEKFPKDSKVKVTDLLNEARKPLTKTKKDGTIEILEKGMSPNKFYPCLRLLEKEGSVKNLDKDPSNLKENYYIKTENVLPQMSAEMIEKIADSLLSDLRKEVKKTIASELKYVKKEDNLTEKEERAFVNEIINQEELKLTLGRILEKHGKELKKSAYRQTTESQIS